MQSKLIYCFATPIDRYGFEELCEYIRENFGGGLYRLIGTKKGQRGSAFNKLLEIAEVVQPKKPGDTNTAPNVGGIMDSVANMLAQSQERTEQMLARMTALTPPALLHPPADPFDMMQKMVAMFSAMGIFGAKPAGTDLLGELEKLAKIQTLIGGMGGEGGGNAAESNFWDLATQGLKTVGPVLAAVAQKGLPAFGPAAGSLQPHTPVTIDHATQAPAAVAPPRQHPSQNPVPENQNVNLKRQVDMLTALAESETEVEDAANMVLNATPDARVAELKAFISRPTVIDEMAALNPAVNLKHRVFFEALKTSILDMLAAEAAAIEAPAPEA